MLWSTSASALAVVGDADEVGTVVLRWFRIIALCTIYGGLGLMVLRSRYGAGPTPRRLLSAVSVAAAAYATVLFANLVTVDVAPAARTPLLLGTAWGRWQCAGIALGITVAVAASQRIEGPLANRAVPVSVVAAVGLSIVEAVSGHVVRTHTVAVDAIAALHVLSAASWLGVLGAAVLAPWARAARPDVVALWRFLVLDGLIAAATGLVDAGAVIATVPQLWTSAYGRVLTAKVVLAVLVAIGGAIIFANGGRRRAGFIVPIGAVAGLLLAAAALGKVPPSAGGQAAGVAGTSFSTLRGDLVVAVAVAPNQPGSNGVTVRVASNRRPAPDAITGVALRVAGPGGRTVALQPAGDDQYFGAADLAAAGPIAGDVIVMRASGAVTVPVSWTVDKPPPARSVPTSVAGVVDPVAAVLAAAAAGLLLWWALLSRWRWGISRLPSPADHDDPDGDRLLRVVLEDVS